MPSSLLAQASLLEEGASADPYELYQRLRAPERPIRDAILGVQLVARHAQVVQLFESPDGRPAIGGTGVEPEHLDPNGQQRLTAIRAAMARWLTYLPPDEHARRRRALTPALPALLGPPLRRRVAALADALLDQITRSTPEGDIRFDAVGELAQPLPVLVIGEILGMPESERPRLVDWSRSILTYFEIGNADPAATVDSMFEALEEMADLVRGLIAARRERGVDEDGDFIARLVAADELSDDEIVATAVQLLFAGHETTRNLLGNGLWTLLRHEGSIERLRRDPSLLRSTVEECLRYESPLQISSRTFDHGASIDGMHFEPGETAILVLGAANRDPQAFDNADRFDLARGDRRHVAFGRGKHFCLGAALSRLEGEVFFERLLARFTDLTLDGPVEWRPSFAFRGLERLPLRATPAAAGELE
ncbi:MAG: cytochrome P450 [Acidobacteriota bacterium]